MRPPQAGRYPPETNGGESALSTATNELEAALERARRRMIDDVQELLSSNTSSTMTLANGLVEEKRREAKEAREAASRAVARAEAAEKLAKEAAASAARSQEGLKRSVRRRGGVAITMSIASGMLTIFILFGWKTAAAIVVDSFRGVASEAVESEARETETEIAGIKTEIAGIKTEQAAITGKLDEILAALAPEPEPESEPEPKPKPKKPRAR